MISVCPDFSKVTIIWSHGQFKPQCLLVAFFQIGLISYQTCNQGEAIHHFYAPENASARMDIMTNSINVMACYNNY